MITTMAIVDLKSYSQIIVVHVNVRTDITIVFQTMIGIAAMQRGEKMDDSISRQAAIKLLEEWADGYSYLEVPVDSIAPKLNELPTAEKKGKWINGNCSVCGSERPLIRINFRGCCIWEAKTAVNYCPNCGARMENAAGVPDSSIESC